MATLMVAGSVGQASMTAARPAPMDSVVTFSPSLVQAAEGVVASLVLLALAIDGSLVPKLDVAASISSPARLGGRCPQWTAAASIKHANQLRMLVRRILARPRGALLQ